MRFIFGLLVSVSIAFAAPPKSVRAQLEANYAQFASAWHAKNLDPTYALMTDDFTATRMGPGSKPIDRQHMIAQTKELLVADQITWPRRILSVSVHGHTAVAIVDGHYTGITSSRNGGKPSKLELFAKTKDTWALVGTTWKFKRMEILSSTMKFEGKPMRG